MEDCCTSEHAACLALRQFLTTEYYPGEEGLKELWKDAKSPTEKLELLQELKEKVVEKDD